jgi:diguanylate cyclase (GGDEF)-like protein
VEGATLARIEFLIRNLEVSIENQRRYIQAKKLSYIDDLTGLYNSRYLDMALGTALGMAGNAEKGFSVLFIDIDYFKKVNDGYGHLIGSQLLIQVGSLIRKSVRAIDKVFRYGGDEFIVLLSEVSAAIAMETAERVRQEIERRTFKFQGAQLSLTVSIGVACFPEHGLDKKEIIRLADVAMYSSKKRGRNQVLMASEFFKQAA